MTPPTTCACAKPIPVERATRKGAATTVCARCELPIAPKLSRAA
jgi:hypothetical protein